MPAFACRSISGDTVIYGGIERHDTDKLLTIRVIRTILIKVKDKDLLKLLLKDGWKLVSVKGSHHKITKNGKTEIIPVHGKDVKKGLLAAILKRTEPEAKK